MMILKDFWFIWMKNENVKSEFASRVNFAMQVNLIQLKIYYSPEENSPLTLPSL